MRVSLNPNKQIVKEIREALKVNNNYCPSSKVHNQFTKCMCEEFRNMIEDEKYGSSCKCGLYIISED